MMDRGAYAYSFDACVYGGNDTHEQYHALIEQRGPTGLKFRGVVPPYTRFNTHLHIGAETLTLLAGGWNEETWPYAGKFTMLIDVHIPLSSRYGAAENLR